MRDIHEMTPGPLVVRGDAEVYSEANGGFTVASCQGYQGERNANARLFAAAPDMLAALRRIANETCNHGPGFCPRDHAKATLKAIGVAL